MFIWMMQNILLLNVVCWSSIMSPSVMWRKKIVCSLHGQGHSKGLCDQSMTLSTISSELLIPSQPALVWWYIIIDQSVLWKKWDNFIQGQGHNEGSKCQWLSRYLLKHPTFCCQTWYCDASLWAGVRAKRFVCYFQGQGHSKGSYDQNMTVSTLSAELLILLLPNLVYCTLS